MRAKLTITVDYDDKGADCTKDVIRGLLEAVYNDAVGDGRLSGDYELECEGWAHKVEFPSSSGET